MASGYVRTRISRLKVSGYRSLYDVELTDLPDVLVLLGRNGAGKSNLMRVPGLVLQWAAQAEGSTRAKPLRLEYLEANRLLDLRPTDFSNGRPPELRIELDMQLGTAMGQRVNRSPEPLGELKLVAHAQDTGRGLSLWFSTMTLADFDVLQARAFDDGPQLVVSRLLHELEHDSPLLRCEAYRSLVRETLTQSPTGQLGASTFQRRMLAAHVDPDIGRRRQLKRLGQRLAEVGAFPQSASVELSPVEDKQFQEYRLYVSLPEVGDVPLENLGTGQQQLIMMAADALVERRPIVMIEEPEAHLHSTLMEAFARFLRLEAEQAGNDSPIDQVWISTHHHAFAIAREYFEVEHTAQTGTTVRRRERAYAAPHFYEPGPLWDALRAVASSTSRETVVMHDSEGQAVTAGAILDSVEGDRVLANDFAEAATRAVVTRFRKQPVQAS
ncbi:MAG: AAA family ATPase [Nannocystaceae bacterium]